MTATLANIDEQDTVLFLESDLTSKEWTERQADELAIEMAGKDRLEKALIIGEKLSHIYNSGSFRRSAPGGERWTWEDWVTKRLPELLPGEAPKLTQANCRRFLWEVRKLVSPHRSAGAVSIPSTAAQAEALQGLIPRKSFGNSSTGQWQPAVFDDPEQAKGLQLVWELAQRNAAENQRKNGPTTDDVRSAREELRPQLTALGLIREAPKAFQQSTAERMAEAAARREQVVDVRTTEQKAADEERFQQTLRDVRANAPERARQARVNEVKEELERPDRERRERLERKVRDYSGKISAAYQAVHDLLIFLQGVDRIDGTQYLDEMRSIDVMGLISVKDDRPRIKQVGEDLMEIAQLVNSCNPPTGIDMTTFTVDAEVD